MKSDKKGSVLIESIILFIISIICTGLCISLLQLHIRVNHISYNRNDEINLINKIYEK